MSTLLMMIGIGGMEFLVIIALIGAVAGYFFRNKTSKNGTVTGIVFGIIGALLTTIALSTFLGGGMLIMPLYGILGAWLFNFIWNKIAK